MFFLALTFGPEHDPPTAVERMVGFVEAVAGKQGIKEPLQMTIGTSDGDRAWNEVPESSYGLVHHGHDELHPFRPRP